MKSRVSSWTLGWILLVPFVCSILSGCGYSTGSIYPENKTISIPVFQNETLWRELETDLTNTITRRVIQKTPYTISDPDEADMVLEGKITSFSEPQLAEDPQDRKIISGVTYNVHITLTNQNTGKIKISEDKSFKARFTGRIGENTQSGRRQAQENIARWVLKQLEKTPWENQ